MSSDTLTAGEFIENERDVEVRLPVIYAAIVSLVFGTAAILCTGAATSDVVFAFGWLLLLAGVTQTVQAFQTRVWIGYVLSFFAGVTRATVGALLAVYPTAGLDALTLVLSFYLMVGGLYRTFGSIELRFPSWRWSVASGLASMALALLLATPWPGQGRWFVGFAIGLDLLVYGWALLMLAAAMKDTPLSLDEYWRKL